MDDLKLYSKTEEEIKSLLDTVDIFSADIGMSFGIGKCAHIGVMCMSQMEWNFLLGIL